MNLIFIVVYKQEIQLYFFLKGFINYFSQLVLVYYDNPDLSAVCL